MQQEKETPDIMKKTIIALLICISITTIASAQQITRFGVIDTARVYTTYFRDSAPVRNYDAKYAEFQKEVTRLTAELQELNSRKIDVQKAGNDTELQRVTALITEKKDFLYEYTNAKNIELASLKKSLENSDDFYALLYATIEKIAESDGYSLILSLQQANTILWYSSAVDITDEVISALSTAKQ
jgi:outer membrane protein